jgi:hypothetical protein
MKLYITLLIFVFNFTRLSAQYGMDISYIFSDITTDNIGIAINYKIKDKHQFSLGIKYHFNNDSTKPLFRYFYRNLYTTNFINKMGLTFEYRLNFRPNKILQPYLFYNFQFIRIGSKFKRTLWGRDSTNVFVTKIEQKTFDPNNYFENYIGVGLNLNINRCISFFSGISVGGTFFTGIRNAEDVNNGLSNYFFASSMRTEFSWLFNTGLTYKFDKGKKKGKRFSKKKY